MASEVPLPAPSSQAKGGSMTGQGESGIKRELLEASCLLCVLGFLAVVASWLFLQPEVALLCAGIGIGMSLGASVVRDVVRRLDG